MHLCIWVRLNQTSAQSARTVEYADSISVEELDPPLTSAQSARVVEYIDFISAEG